MRLSFASDAPLTTHGPERGAARQIRQLRTSTAIFGVERLWPRSCTSNRPPANPVVEPGLPSPGPTSAAAMPSRCGQSWRLRTAASAVTQAHISGVENCSNALLAASVPALQLQPLHANTHVCTPALTARRCPDADCHRPCPPQRRTSGPERRSSRASLPAQTI